MKPAPVQVNSSTPWQHLGAELVFTQNSLGQYLSFSWELADQYKIEPQAIVGTSVEDDFIPVAIEAYQERIRRVLERRIPEQCHCLFQYGSHSLLFELVISPILPMSGQANSVLVMGHLLPEEASAGVINSPLPANPDPYQRLLTKIGRKIRSTLDFDTICYQTVNELGKALGVSRCLIISYNADKQRLKAEAEYCHSPYPSILTHQFNLAVETPLKQALDMGELVIVDQLNPDVFIPKSLLVVSTRYQKQPNALLYLQQCDRRRQWSVAEMELVQELADQVGTALAYAILYKELREARLQAEEASRLKSEFLATTSHELRTPLNGIIGFLKLILDGFAEDPQEQREFLEEAHSSALHLLNLINDILDIAKIEAGKMELDLGEVSLDELFDAIESFSRTQAEQKHLSFQIKRPPTYDRVILYGNYQRLKQVLLNLTGNALKFTDEGGVTISAEVIKKKVKIHHREFPGMVKVSVADTGIGVSLEQQDKLFKFFSQVDGSYTRTYEGTGLGLAISQKLVEAMGGKVHFYSMGEGLGSTVTFTIPLHQIPVINTTQQDNHTIDLPL
ncbi:MAG: GAF domain-containing sensor histidine kinase [Chroococcales cyanobacterium]